MFPSTFRVFFHLHFSYTCILGTYCAHNAKQFWAGSSRQKRLSHWTVRSDSSVGQQQKKHVTSRPAWVRRKWCTAVDGQLGCVPRHVSCCSSLDWDQISDWKQLQWRLPSTNFHFSWLVTVNLQLTRLVHVCVGGWMLRLSVRMHSWEANTATLSSGLYILQTDNSLTQKHMQFPTRVQSF